MYSALYKCNLKTYYWSRCEPLSENVDSTNLIWLLRLLTRTIFEDCTLKIYGVKGAMYVDCSPNEPNRLSRGLPQGIIIIILA